VELPNPSPHSVSGAWIRQVDGAGKVGAPESQAQTGARAVGILKIQVDSSRETGIQSLLQGLDLRHPLGRIRP
jgi:hypothetical protein